MKSMKVGMAGCAQWAVYVIVALVVIFGDVMFIKLMWTHFPDGLLRIGALGGAVATACSILVLLVGKAHWFRPGPQLIFAYAFTGVEVAVSLLNVLLASGVTSGLMVAWDMAAPASPFVALVGWVIVLQLDQATVQKHEDMEMEDDIKRAERDYKRLQHEAGMRIKRKALEYNEQYMLEALENPAHQQSLQQGAEKLAIQAIHQLTGRYIPPPDKTVQSTLQSDSDRVSLAQTGQPPAEPSARPSQDTQPLVSVHDLMELAKQFGLKQLIHFPEQPLPGEAEMSDPQTAPLKQADQESQNSGHQE